MTAVVESAARAQVIRESAADLKWMAESFLAAHRAAKEAWERFRLTDCGGWSGLEDEAERLDGVAEDAYGALDFMRLTESGLPADLMNEVLDAAEEYAGRRRRTVGHAVVRSAPVDWSRGR